MPTHFGISSPFIGIPKNFLVRGIYRKCRTVSNWCVVIKVSAIEQINLYMFMTSICMEVSKASHWGNYQKLENRGEKLVLGCYYYILSKQLNWSSDLSLRLKIMRSIAINV